MDKKKILILGLFGFPIVLSSALTLSQTLSSMFALAANTDNTLIISPSNPITNGYVKTTKGNNIYVKDDGVTWGSSNLSFENGGYIQTLSIIHGIQSVSVELSSGSLQLYHGYVEPTNLETPMYDSNYSFVSTSTYTYTSNLPNRVRLRASEATVISKITIMYDCLSAEDDLFVETIEDGLENSFIDAGAIRNCATTSYVTDTSSQESKRALKTEYKGTNNNYFSLSPQMNVIRELSDNLPDFTNAILTLKAKFSDNIENHEISVNAIGSSWTSSNYIKMNLDEVSSDGWNLFSLDFTNVNFANINEIIRINLKPLGINDNNKATGYVIFDEINYHKHTLGQEFAYESIYDGLENLSRDKEMENVYVTFDNKTVYGRASKSSLVARPKESIGSNPHYYVVLSPEHHVSSGLSTYLSTKVSESILMFEYKPINIKNPSTLYLHCLENWSNAALRTVTTSELNNGWYRLSFDFKTLGFTSPDMIRIKIGFDVDSANINDAKVYFDNIRLKSVEREDYTQGLENLSADGGMSGYVSGAIDQQVTASEASLNSFKYVINGTKSGWQGNRGVMYVDANGSSNMRLNTGVLEAKFLFSGNFASKEIRLDLVDSHWTGAWFKGIIPESLDNGWYQMSVNLSTLESWNVEDKYQTGNFDYTSYPIRIGFSFIDAVTAGSNNLIVWVDDVFYYPTTSSADFTLWQAYDTENIRQTDDTISSRNVSISKPLSFSDARNGTDSSQLMIKANSTISSFNFRPGSLRGNHGDLLPATCFEVLVAKYINIGNTGETGKTGHMGTGWYPDALVPIDRIIKAEENNIVSGKQQSIWLNCKVPINQRAGTYTGNGILTINGTDYVVPMEVVVYDFTIDDTRHNKTSFLIWFDRLEIAEPEYTRTMRQTYYDFCIERGISLDSNYDWSRWTVGDMNIYDSFADNFAKYIMPNNRITTYRIPAEKTEASILAYLTALVNRNKVEWDNGNHVNFFEKAIFILSDEPANPSWNNPEPQAWKDCKSIQTWIKSAQSSLSSTLNNYPVIQAGLNSVRNVVTVGCDYDRITGGGLFYKDLLNTDHIGVPCPQFGKVDNASERNTYLSRFEKTWFYGCSNPQLPYPSYHMDTPLIGQRLITWMQYDYGFEGTLYFCVNMFSTSDQGTAILRDVWTNPMVGSFAGDGQLLYPGNKYNIYGPITSMRLENLRNSMEDYELFYLMDQHLDTYNAKTGSNISSCRELLSSEFTQMFNGTQLLARGHTFSSSYKSQDFEEIRTYLLERLEYCF